MDKDNSPAPPVQVPAIPEPTLEYVIPEAMRKRLENDFTHHPPKGDQAARYVKIRNMAKELAFFICAKTPPGREQSAALSHLEQAVFLANAAIARGE